MQVIKHKTVYLIEFVTVTVYLIGFATIYHIELVIKHM